MALRVVADPQQVGGAGEGDGANCGQAGCSMSDPARADPVTLPAPIKFDDSEPEEETEDDN